MNIKAQYSQKIVNIKKLKKLFGNMPRKKKIILCHGNFDVVHPGHVRHLLYGKSKGDLLIVTRRIEEKGGDNEDFFVSSRREDSTWSKLISLGKPFNSSLNEGALAYSADKNTVIYTACNRRDGFGSCDLYFSSSDLSWKEVLNAGVNINSKHWESQACFSPDGKYLYFVSNRPGGYGGRDIWVSEISEKGFGKAYNLGPNINTKYDEMSPFIHADNLTLYFASNGHIGMGDYDLFVSRRVNTQKDWQEPKNLGYPINTYLIENSLPPVV